MRNYLTQEALSEVCIRNVFIAPIAGALFLMFLPVIGFVLLAEAMVQRAGEVVQGWVTPQAVVGESYLTGTQSDAKLSERSDEELEKLAKEIEKKRLDGSK